MLASPLSMRIPRLVLAAMLWAWLCAPAAAEEARIVVLHTTDLHGALTPYDYLADRPAARGLVKLATMVEAVRAEKLPTLLLDGGDCIEGSPLVTIYRHHDRALPDPMMAAMTRMRYDAMAIGNHEFDFGREALEQTRAAATFPWLAANVVKATDGAPAFGTSIVKMLGPLRVGVVGLTTPAVPSWEDSENVAGLRFLSPLEAARREVDRLRRAERCDLVVLLAHTGLERDPVTGAERRGDTPDENWGFRLATEVPGVDLIVLGHTHVVVPSAQIGGTLVTQAGKWGEGLGRVDLTLTRSSAAEPWKVVSRRAQVLAVADSTAPDTSLARLADPYHRAAQEVLATVIGTAARDIASPGGRYEDGPLWELIHRVQLEATGADVSLAALPDPAARIAWGPITARDLLRAYPFGNTLSAVELSGAALKQVLEHSARYLSDYTFEAGRPLSEPGYPGYNFDSAEGVTYEIDLTRPAGERIARLSFRGEPLAPDRRLKVAVNSYRVHGGGGFPALSKAPIVWHQSRDIRELLIDHVRRARTLDGGFTRNWGIVPDYASARERPLIDLLVRQGVLDRSEALHLSPEAPARRGDLAYWLARAFGWREQKLSGAFADAPDSLEPWLDGLLKRRVLRDAGSSDQIQPFAPARLSTALDWCERAARHERYRLKPTYDATFRDGLLAGVGVARRPAARGDTLTRSQALGIVANTRFPWIRILETTDFHGAILSVGRDRRTGRAIGTSPVLAAHIERLRAENPEGTVLIDGGDLFQGTMISNLQFGRPMVEQMNALHYAAAAIGNHEFDWSADTLERRVREMRFAELGANLRERRTGRMPAWVRADTVFTRRGVRIGVLGLCYRFTPTVTLATNVRHLEFQDDSTTAARLVPQLRTMADVVIGVGHIPAETDSTRRLRGGDLARLARGVKGVDAWFGGHSHNQVLDRVDGVPVMIAGAHGEVIGVCDLVMDPVKHRVVESRADLVLTYADQVTPDSAMQARVERWNSAVAPIASKPIGKCTRRLTLSRGGESTVGDFVADAIRRALGVDIALQNSGGLRAELGEGTVTRGAIYEVMPFDNVIFTLELTGAEVRRALEQALRYGRVTQVSGVRYRFDRRRPDFQRIVSLTDTAGVALDENRIYKVACNDFMATGGDNYDVLSGGRNRTATGVLVRDVLEAYVAQRSKTGSLDVSLDGRIESVGQGGSGGN